MPSHAAADGDDLPAADRSDDVLRVLASDCTVTWDAPGDHREERGYLLTLVEPDSPGKLLVRRLSRAGEPVRSSTPHLSSGRTFAVT